MIGWGWWWSCQFPSWVQCALARGGCVWRELGERDQGNADVAQLRSKPSSAAWSTTGPRMTVMPSCGRHGELAGEGQRYLVRAREAQSGPNCGWALIGEHVVEQTGWRLAGAVTDL